MSRLDETIIELMENDELDGYYDNKISQTAKRCVKALILELIGDMDVRETSDMSLKSWTNEDYKAFGKNELRAELHQKVAKL